MRSPYAYGDLRDPHMHTGIDFDPRMHMGITRSDWLTPWQVTMFVPRRGKNYNVHNQYMMELIISLPPAAREALPTMVTPLLPQFHDSGAQH